MNARLPKVGDKSEGDLNRSLEVVVKPLGSIGNGDDELKTPAIDEAGTGSPTRLCDSVEDEWVDESAGTAVASSRCNESRLQSVAIPHSVAGLSKDRRDS